MKTELLSGADFEQMRPKLKKDKSYFAKLDNKEKPEFETQEQVAIIQPMVNIPVEENLILPFGNQNSIK